MITSIFFFWYIVVTTITIAQYIAFMYSTIAVGLCLPIPIACVLMCSCWHSGKACAGVYCDVCISVVCLKVWSESVRSMMRRSAPPRPRSGW